MDFERTEQNRTDYLFDVNYTGPSRAVGIGGGGTGGRAPQ